MPTTRRTNEERTRSTRQALVAAARQRFEADGYRGTNLQDVAELAGVTKGALYHHFPSKQALYEAVVVRIHDELYSHSRRRSHKAETAWDGFIESFVAVIEVAPEAGTQLLLLEAPAVLGYRRWREIDDERNLPGIIRTLERLEASGELAFQASDLARVLGAMTNALATLVSQDEDPVARRAAVLPIWEHVLRSLKAPSAPR